MCAKAARAASFQDHEQALSDACRTLSPVTVCAGESEFLRTDAISQILAALARKHPGIEELTLHGIPPAGGGESGASLSDVLGELGAGSLFASSRVIVLRRGDRTLYPQGEGTAAAEIQKKFTEYMKQPSADTWLVIECESLNRQRVVGKALAADAVHVPCPSLTRQADVSHWLRGEAKRQGKNLESGVSDILFTAHGGNLGTLAAEIGKLALYVGSATTIAVRDAEQFLTGSVEFDVFGLTNAIEKRDLSESLLFARRIGSLGTRDKGGKRSDGEASTHQALSMLSRTMEQIFLARVVADRGGDENDAAGEVGASPWRAKRLLEAASLFSMPELRHILTDLAQLMHSTHDTGGDPHLSLERAVLACCQRKRGA